MNLALIRKALVALATMAAALLSAGLIPQPWGYVVAAVLGALGVGGVYQVPNAVAGGTGGASNRPAP